MVARVWHAELGTGSVMGLLLCLANMALPPAAVLQVQTLRNAIMLIALMTQAAAYIGARGLPQLLLDSEYSAKLTVLGDHGGWQDDPSAAAGQQLCRL